MASLFSTSASRRRNILTLFIFYNSAGRSYKVSQLSRTPSDVVKISFSAPFFCLFVKLLCMPAWICIAVFYGTSKILSRKLKSGILELSVTFLRINSQEKNILTYRWLKDYFMKRFLNYLLFILFLYLFEQYLYLQNVNYQPNFDKNGWAFNKFSRVSVWLITFSVP